MKLNSTKWFYNTNNNMSTSTNNKITEFYNSNKIKPRPDAGPGLWLMFLLPSALILTTIKHSIITTLTYQLSAIFSIGLIGTSLIILSQFRNGDKIQILNLWLIKTMLITSTLFHINLNQGFLFSLVSGLTSTIIYNKTLFFFLRKLSNCFTLGEASIVTQSFVMFIYFTIINLLENFSRHNCYLSIMQIETIIIQLGLFGIFLICWLIYLFNIRRPLSAYTTATIVIVTIILLPLHFLLGESPILWIISVILKDFTTIKIVLYWSFCSALATLAIWKQINEAQKASTVIRKIFHVLAVVVYIPGLLYDCLFLYLASGVVLGIFIALQILLILDIPPLSHYLRDGLVVFGDEKDVGIIALTPIYLLSGCSLPLWIHPAPCDITNSCTFTLLPLLSGLLTIGIGDTAASVVGSIIGRYKWAGSRKTVEGSIACMIFQGLSVYLLIYLDFIKLNFIEEYVKIVIAIIVASIVEAKTDQVDNVVLPLIMYIILI